MLHGNATSRCWKFNQHGSNTQVMILLARFFCILALTAFGAGAVANSAESSVMVSGMMTADGMTAMDDCDACGTPDTGFKGSVCDFVCNATAMVALPVVSTDAGAVPFSSTHERLPERTARGITGPPAKEPPRFYF